MAKKKKKSTPVQHRPQPKALTPKLERQLEHIDELLADGETTEAGRQLEELHQTNPRNPDILWELLRIFAQVDDKRHYLRYAQRLAELIPGDEDALKATATAYLLNMFPALAIKSYQTFLRRFPNSPEIAEIRSQLEKLIPILHQSLEGRNLPEENWLEVAIQQDMVRFNLEFGYFAEARSAANQLLRLVHNFTPALNNLSQVEWIAGNAEAAISNAKRVLEIDPANYHACANIARYFLFSGKSDEAVHYIERLKSIQSDDTDIWLKKLEAYSYVGDDKAVLDTIEQALESERADVIAAHAIFWHYGAVAAMRLGDEETARLWWERALEEEPNFELAKENLDDLEKPSHERYAPWLFGLGEIISRTEIDKVLRAIQSTAASPRELSPTEISRLVAQFPGIVQRLALSLQRGDAQARDFALRFASFFDTPDIIEVVKNYAQGQDGPDESRTQAAMLVYQKKALPSGNQRMWLRGQWSDLLLFGFEITEEPSSTFKHSDEVIELLANAIEATNEERFEEAEGFLQQALALDPGKPDLLNNLAALYNRQGRDSEGNTLIREIFAQHPDYFFAITNMANIYVQQGELEEAQKLIEPLLQQDKYHISEMRALCQTQINLSLTKKEVANARRWFEMWEQFDEGNPQLEYWKEQIDVRDMQSELSNLADLMKQMQNYKPRRRRK